MQDQLVILAIFNLITMSVMSSWLLVEHDRDSPRKRDGLRVLLAGMLTIPPGVVAIPMMLLVPERAAFIGCLGMVGVLAAGWSVLRGSGSDMALYRKQSEPPDEALRGISDDRVCVRCISGPSRGCVWLAGLVAVPTHWRRRRGGRPAFRLTRRESGRVPSLPGASRRGLLDITPIPGTRG